jgi:hypothetical protein
MLSLCHTMKSELKTRLEGLWLRLEECIGTLTSLLSIKLRNAVHPTHAGWTQPSL